MLFFMTIDILMRNARLCWRGREHLFSKAS